MSAAKNKPVEPKFPGYWRGKDDASKSRSRMVGSAQESTISEIHRYTKEHAFERKLQKAYNKFLEQAIVDKLDNPIPITRTSYVEPDVVEKPKTTTELGGTFTKKDQVNHLVDLLYGDPNDPESVQALAAARKKFGIDAQPEGFGPGRPPGAVSVPYAQDTEPVPLSPRQQAIQNIATANKIADPNKIKIGQVLTLPDGSTYTVAKGDNLWNISKGRFKGQPPKSRAAMESYLQEYQTFVEYGNAQDPNTQTTSPQRSSGAAQQQQQEKEQQDQRVDVASAKALASSIKTALPPTVDPNTVASALTKINDQNSGRPAKPLTQPEQMAMGPVNALFAKAAETPQTSTELATILRNVSTLMKKGKA